MKKLILLLAVVALNLNLSTNLSAQDILNAILERGELRVGTSGDQPPFSMTADNATLFGLDVDMANGLAQSIGVRPKVIKMKFRDLIPALERGEIDMIISGLTMTMDRNKKIAFIGPYVISGNTVAVKDVTYLAADEIADVDVAGNRIAVMQGTTSEEFVVANVTKATIYKSPTNKEALNLLKNDKVDIVIAGYPTVKLALMEDEYSDLKTIAEPLDYEPIGIGVAPSDPLFLNLVQNYLNGLERSGILGLLKTNWFEQGSWMAE